MFSVPLFRTDEIRRIEAAASGLQLMQRAGSAAADFAATLFSADVANSSSHVLVLAGPGNNGGDALVVALHLRKRRFDVRVVFAGDTEKLPKDAAQAYRQFVEEGGVLCATIPGDLRWELIVDGLFGIGLKREISGRYAELVEQANNLAARDACPLLALDCPSGLDSDTGRASGIAICASHTITFIGGKPGLFTADGPDLCGMVKVATLDLDVASNNDLPSEPVGQLVVRALFSGRLKRRANNSHKGTYGNAGVLGGAHSMVGAALLAARAALHLGSGRVYVGLLDDRAPSFDPGQPELMLRNPDLLFGSSLTALACGPGMGNTAAATQLLERALTLSIPLVLDADALNLVARHEPLQRILQSRSAPSLLTPHPAEAARLLGCDVAMIQADRPVTAIRMARRFNALVALKGAGTVIATPDGRWFINTSGNPGLATAGSGDVLTGFVTALLAQGWPPCEALMAAVHLHGTAAERLVGQGQGPIGLTAGELIDSARCCFNQWIYHP
ncbi:NAD(P)H-hydrate dehydratase [Propionivibrio limicola]|uniref:NAD(P)H-hydrate dehydratase n=1 Tax=Propionivibrio limicola TaxID=167645 RepID=UPI0012925F5A|nr:NAD(P)H-hydrate dehydratase [Propionivibrio limicola]